MSEKIYFFLLILCGIWSQGIIEAFADEEIKESSDFLVREKRVVSHVPGEDHPVPIQNAPYVVVIKHLMRLRCVGNILSKYAVITAATCVPESPSEYQITYGESNSHRSTNNNVTDIRKHFHIALVVVALPFVYSERTYFIKLHQEPLLPGVVATVSGWGFNFRCTERGTSYPLKLRSIKVPIMSHQDCANRYLPRIVISDKEICTFDTQRHCGHNDFGAGLVIDGFLAGVHIWTGIEEGRINPFYPDVFAVLQDFEYNQWIRSNLQNINEENQYRRHPLFPQHA